MAAGADEPLLSGALLPLPCAAPPPSDMLAATEDATEAAEAGAADDEASPDLVSRSDAAMAAASAESTTFDGGLGTTAKAPINTCSTSIGLIAQT